MRNTLHEQGSQLDAMKEVKAMGKELDGRVAFITGGSGDIGRAIARELGEAGAILVIGDIEDERTEETVELLRRDGFKAHPRRLDVRDFAACHEAIDSIVREHRGLHVLINGAGVYREAWVAEMREEEWDEALDINLKGVFNCCRAAARPMSEASWGRIVSISSISGLRPSREHAHYCASKAGMIGFSRTLAQELAPHVTVNCVAPGIIATRMSEAMIKVRGEEWLRAIPLARFGTAEDVAHAVGFLVSEKAGYISGVVLQVNGGMFMD